jgi:AraC-like DNA-binding protein
MRVEALPRRASVIAAPRFDRWSTATVAPHLRLEYWHEVTSQATIATSISSGNRDNFFGEITRRKFSDSAFYCFNSSDLEIVRSEQHVRRGGYERTFLLTLPFSGQAHIEQGGRKVILKSQRMGILDGGLPFTVTFGEVRRMVAALPYSLVLRHMPRLRQMPALEVDPAHPCADIIREYVIRLSQPQFAIDGIAGDVMSEHLCVLLGVALSSQLGTESESSSSRQIRKTVLLGYIRRNALDPELTPSVTARAVGMSLRSVHNLMRDTGHSFSEWVLDARLTHARRLLQGAGAERRKIVDIALASGFSDLSHFNRMFKARFGCTPREARELPNSTPVSVLPVE